MKHRVGRVPQRDRVIAVLRGAFAKAVSQQDLFNRLTDAHLELYRRGKSVSVIDHDGGRKHRLATLGLDADYAAMTGRLERSSAVQQAQAIVKQKAASIQPKPQSAQAAHPNIQISPSRQSTTEADVNVLDALTQGLAALVDAASLSSPSATPASAQKADAADVHHEPQSDRDRIAAEQLAEMQERREDQDRDREHQQDQSRTRTR